MESSIDSPATPVFTPRATLTPTFSGSIGKAAFEIGIDGQIDRRAQRGEMIADLIDGDAVVGPGDGPGKTRAGGRQRLEAEMLQRAGAAGIERIGDDEAAALVHLLEIGALVRGRHRHVFSP